MNRIENLLTRISKLDDEERMGLAYETTDIEVLNILAEDTEPYVREFVAKNCSATEIILYKLANDESPDVRLAVVENPHTSVKTIEMLADDTDYDVCYVIASSRNNVSVNALKKLVTCKKWSIREAVAQNPCTYPSEKSWRCM